MSMVIEKEIFTGTKRLFLDEGIIINAYTHILPGAIVSKNVMIGEHCYIASKAVILENTRIQNHVSVWDGVVIGKNVFVGPKVCFTNHHDPEISPGKDFKPDTTTVGKGAILCANCTIVAPCHIGERAKVAAGTTLTRDLEENEVYYGHLKEYRGS